MKNIFFISVLLLLAWTACRKNFDETTQKIQGLIPSEPVNGGIIGLIRDENGAPVANQEVFINNGVYETNSVGVVSASTMVLNAARTEIEVRRNGYFTATRFVYPEANATTLFEITLFPRTLKKEFSAAQGAKIDIESGAFAEIPANGLVDVQGKPYFGPVRAYAVWLDPTDKKTFETMPGDLRARDREGYVKFLKTFGMIGVELEDMSGLPLNIAPNTKAKLSFPVPTSMRNAAPAEIPMWYFNQFSSYWDEEGTAQLIDGNYVAEVSHFSFWNCDIPTDFIELSLNLQNANGQPLVGLYASVTSEEYGQAYGISNSNGYIKGYVPSGEKLLLSVLDRCYNKIFEKEIGPFNQNTDIGQITLPVLNDIQISGKLVRCDGEPVEDGFIIIENPDITAYVFKADQNGNFTANIVNCIGLTELSFTAFDSINNTQSTNFPITFPIDNLPVDLGSIPVCTSLEEYITITCKGITTTYFIAPSFNGANKTILAVADTLGFNSIFLNFNNYNSINKTAVLSILNFTRNEFGQFYLYNCNYCDSGCQCAPANPINFQQYPSMAGDFAVGSVSGEVRDTLKTTFEPFQINFRVKQD